VTNKNINYETALQLMQRR